MRLYPRVVGAGGIELAPEEVEHQPRDLGALVFEREVAGVEQVELGVGQIAEVSTGAFGREDDVLFEIPTGVVADTWGRRTSYLLGAATLLVSTLLYLGMWQLRAPFWAWGRCLDGDRPGVHVLLGSD